jgi:GT2 family glycosyltransferase
VLQGRVTGIVEGAITGWVEAGADDCCVEASALGEAPFGQARAAPGDDGRLHFAIPIPEHLQDGRIRFLDVRPLGSDRALDGGPVVFDGGLFSSGLPGGAAPSHRPPAAGLVEGAVEIGPPSRLTGWAWAPADPARRLRIEILAGERLLAVVTADKQRDELSERRLGDGRYGFEVSLARLLRHGPHELTVRVEGAAAPLPGGRVVVGPFAADGEVDCPGYLDDEATRAALERLPLEHLAYNARRIAADRLVPRLINRLRRERLSLKDEALAPIGLLMLPGDREAEALGLWALQSYPHATASRAETGPEEIRAFAQALRWVILARPQDLLHPSAALAVSAFEAADVVSWNRFCAAHLASGSPGVILRRPRFDPVTVRHGAVTDTTLAIRGSLLASAPEPVLQALAEGRLHPLWFWLAGQAPRWTHHPEALTSMLGDAPALRRRFVEADEDWYRQILEQEGGRFTLERVADNLPFPYALVPARRARKTSVLVSFRNSGAMTLKALHALAGQRLTGELELVLVDNQSDPDEARLALAGANELFGAERVRLIAYDAPFNHSAQNNLAARAASGEVVLLLNNDLELKSPEAVEHMAAWALEPGFGAVGCRLWDPGRDQGSFGHIAPEPGADPYRPPIVENTDDSYGLHIHAAPGVTFALAAMARERFLELGGLDEVRFPIGYNDVDLLLRASAAGLTHLYLGHVVAEHARGASRSGDNEDLHALWLRQALDAAGPAHLFQLERIRIAYDRTEGAAPAQAYDPAELAQTLRDAIAARQDVEQRRAEIALGLLRASGVVEELDQTLGRSSELAKALDEEIRTVRGDAPPGDEPA